MRQKPIKLILKNYNFKNDVDLRKAYLFLNTRNYLQSKPTLFKNQLIYKMFTFYKKTTKRYNRSIFLNKSFNTKYPFSGKQNNVINTLTALK